MKFYFTCEYGTKEGSTNFVGLDFDVNLDKDEMAFVHKILSVNRDLRDKFNLLKHHAPQLYRKIMDAGAVRFDKRYKDCRCIYQRIIEWTWELLDATRIDASEMVSDDDCELLFIKACALASSDYNSSDPVIDENNIFSLDYLKIPTPKHYDFAKMADIPFLDWSKMAENECERIYIDLLKKDEEHHNEVVKVQGYNEYLQLFYIDWQQLQLKTYSATLSEENSRFGVWMIEIVQAVEHSLRIINKKGLVWSMFLDDLSYMEKNDHYRLAPIQFASKTKYEATLYEDHDLNSRVLSLEVRSLVVRVNEGDSGPACGMMNGKRAYDRDLYGINLYELAGLLGTNTLNTFFAEMKRRFGFYDGMDRFYEFLLAHNVKFAAYAG